MIQPGFLGTMPVIPQVSTRQPKADVTHAIITQQPPDTFRSTNVTHETIKLLFSGDKPVYHSLLHKIDSQAFASYLDKIQAGEEVRLPVFYQKKLIDAKLMTPQATYQEERYALEKEVTNKYENDPDQLQEGLEQMGFTVSNYQLRIKAGKKAFLPLALRDNLIAKGFLKSNATTFDEERSALKPFLIQVVLKDKSDDARNQDLKDYGFSTKKKKYKKTTSAAQEPVTDTLQPSQKSEKNTVSDPAQSSGKPQKSTAPVSKQWDTGFDWADEAEENIPLPIPTKQSPHASSSSQNAFGWIPPLQSGDNPYSTGQEKKINKPWERDWRKK